MAPKKIKTEISLSLANAARFFRQFAEALEKGDDSLLDDFGISIQDSRKIKMGISRDLDAISLKIKIKNQPGRVTDKTGLERDTPPERNKKNFKEIKKTMQYSFKAVKRALLQGEKPAAEDIRTFVAAAEEMTTHTGYGDPMYGEFVTTCRRLQKAFDDEDIKGMIAAYDAIGRIKVGCHNQYK